jgi:hypothetical protein
MAQVCLNGAYVLKLVDRLGDTVPGPCPAIVFVNGKVLCDIVRHPKKYFIGNKYSEEVLRRNFMKAIGSGEGCDELGDNPTAHEEALMDKYREKKLNDPEFRRKMQVVMKVLYGL